MKILLEYLVRSRVEMFFKVIYYVLFIITFAYGIYFVITGVIGLIKKKKIMK